MGPQPNSSTLFLSAIDRLSTVYISTFGAIRTPFTNDDNFGIWDGMSYLSRSIVPQTPTGTRATMSDPITISQKYLLTFATKI